MRTRGNGWQNFGRATGGDAFRVRRLCASDVGDGRDDLPGHRYTAVDVVPLDVVVARQGTGASAIGLQQVLGLSG